MTTNRRTYDIGLVSKQGEQTHVVNFYYPEESLAQAVQVAHQHENSVGQTEVVDERPQVDVNHLNFNYQLKGDRPAWTPNQVFDDGNKTYIRMPERAAHRDLPVLYLLRRSTMQLVNYRYQRPYYIIDALFDRAILVSGKGRDQEKVIINNEHNS